MITTDCILIVAVNSAFALARVMFSVALFSAPRIWRN